MAKVIEAGSTPGEVTLSLVPAGKHAIFHLRMLGEEGNNKQNLWNLDHCRALYKAYEYVKGSSEGQALVTTSGNPKFFCNGLDIVWLGKTTKAKDMVAFKEFQQKCMPIFAQVLELEIPTIACVNGHAFGAGFMLALSHDYRIQNAEAGFMCANEIQVKVKIPPPEMQIFRHAMTDNDFYETIMSAKRWGAAEALQKGLIAESHPAAELQAKAMAFAEAKAPFGLDREIYGWMKKRTPKGHVARAIREWTAAGLLGGDDGELARVKDTELRSSLEQRSSVYQPQLLLPSLAKL